MRPEIVRAINTRRDRVVLVLPDWCSPLELEQYRDGVGRGRTQAS